MLPIVSTKIFSKRLAEVRLNHNISQRKLSKDLGLSSSAVYYYEKGEKIPSIEILIKLSEYFRISADYFLGLSDDPLGGIPSFFRDRLEVLDILESENRILEEKFKSVLEILSDKNNDK